MTVTTLASTYERLRSCKAAHPARAFAGAGTYAGLIEKLDYLQTLGVNALELMPVHEFNELEYYGVSSILGHLLIACSSDDHHPCIATALNLISALLCQPGLQGSIHCLTKSTTVKFLTSSCLSLLLQSLPGSSAAVRIVSCNNLPATGDLSLLICSSSLEATTPIASTIGAIPQQPSLPP